MRGEGEYKHGKMFQNQKMGGKTYAYSLSQDVMNLYPDSIFSQILPTSFSPTHLLSQSVLTINP